MLGEPAFAFSVDRERVGFFGFSPGAYTGPAVIGANPDWANVTERCQQFKSHVCPPALVAELPYICKDAGDFDRAAFHRRFNADVLAFFQAQLVSAPR